jgi:hypothetical protein
MLDYLMCYIVTEENNEHMKSMSVFLQVSTTTGLLSYLVMKMIQMMSLVMQCQAVY